MSAFSAILVSALILSVSFADITPPEIYDTSDSSLLSLFKSFQSNYSRNYSPAETAKRYDIFRNNIFKINAHNEKYPDISYTLGITKFTDWSKEEFNSLNNFKSSRKNNHYTDISVSALPTSVDWTTVKPSVVTPVKDQGNCGGCWAFGATGSWESRYAIKYGNLSSLSEQELIDCVPANDCILGGDANNAFMYGVKNNGDSLESEYTYKGHDGSCTASKYKHYDALKTHVMIQKHNETAMMAALTAGPITVAADADGWNLYRSGIYDAPCGLNLNHNIILVGYGQDDKGNKYWKVKNSWGQRWGMDGYMLLCRDCGKGVTGECGINDEPSFPVAT
eukprot:341934_1